MNYYEILGVDSNADESTIKTAYRKLAKELHPDINPGNKEAEDKFKKITEAYDTLSDKDKKNAYDFSLKQGSSPFGSSPFGSSPFGFDDDFMSSMFSGGDFFSRTKARKKEENKNGKNIRYSLKIPLEFSVTGKKLDIDISKNETCDSCNGTGKTHSSQEKICNICSGRGSIRSGNGFFVMNQECPKCKGKGKFIENPCSKCKGEKTLKIKKKIRVNIPAGIDEGMGITITGEGDSGIDGGKNGDLFIKIEIIDDVFFKRERHDLYCRLELNMYQAVLGDTIEFNHINGNKIRINVKPSTQSDSVIELKGLGCPIMNQDNKFGSLFISFDVKIPNNIDEKEMEELKKLFENHKNDNKNPKFLYN